MNIKWVDGFKIKIKAVYRYITLGENRKYIYKYILYFAAYL